MQTSLDSTSTSYRLMCVNTSLYSHCVILTGVSGVRDRSNSKGAGFTIVGVGGLGIDGHGGVEGTEVNVGMTLERLDSVGHSWIYQRQA